MRGSPSGPFRDTPVSDRDPLDLIEGGTYRLTVHEPSCAAIAYAFSGVPPAFEIGSNTGRANHVTTQLDLEASLRRTPVDHATGSPTTSPATMPIRNPSVGPSQPRYSGLDRALLHLQCYGL